MVGGYWVNVIICQYNSWMSQMSDESQHLVKDSDFIQNGCSLVI